MPVCRIRIWIAGRNTPLRQRRFRLTHTYGYSLRNAWTGQPARILLVIKRERYRDRSSPRRISDAFHRACAELQPRIH